MNKENIAKSLKRFLKRKISYTTSLLVAFMITGGIGHSEVITLNALRGEQADLLKEIQLKKQEIKNKILENEKQIEEKESKKLLSIREADWYSRKTSEGTGVAFLGKYKIFSDRDKNWKASNRSKSEADNMRDRFSLATGKESGEYLSSGWITTSDDFKANSNIYDAVSKLIVLPVVKAPVVIEPAVPVVSFTSPTAPYIPIIPSVHIAGISVTPVTVAPVVIGAPTVDLPSVPTSPAAVNVSVNDPNINISIDLIVIEEPDDFTLPPLTPPNVSITVAPSTTPVVVPPVINVTTPIAPAAPNFTVYTRKRGNWLGGSGSTTAADGSSQNAGHYGFNSFNRGVKIFETATRAEDHTNYMPFFHLPYITGTGVGSSTITATTIGGVVTNSYTNIKTNTATSTVYPTNKWFNSGTTLVSPVPIVGYGNGTAVSNTDTDPNRYQQQWIFQGAPSMVENITINIGGMDSDGSVPRGGGTALFAQTTGIKMQNVNINLKGYSIIGDVDSQNNYEVKFGNNVKLNIEGNFNTILALSSVTVNRHVYTSQTDARPDSNHWGIYVGDLASNNVGINLGTTDITTATSNNTVFYLSAPYVHRWNGINSLVKAPDEVSYQYYTNPKKYKMYYPSPGNIKFENTGTIKFVGSGNAAAWLKSFVPDRQKVVGGSADRPIINLGTIDLSGDNNVGYYFSNSNVDPSANGVFQGDVVLNAKLGVTLNGEPSGTSQAGTGNSGSSNTKSEKNVAVYVASGQSSNMNKSVGGYRQYYPATLSFAITSSNIGAGVNHIEGVTIGDNIGAHTLGTNANINDLIANLKLTNFTVTFGKYSKESIGVVAKNGSAVNVDVAGATISDNAVLGAEDNVMFFAEGVWYNPRLALTSASYDNDAYGRGESITGRKYISDFNSTINVLDNVVMGSKSSTAFFAKNGAKIDGKSITMNGYSSIGVFAYGTHNYSSIVNSVNGAAGVQPDTTIIAENITAVSNGSGADSHNNIGVIAMSKDSSATGTGNVSATISGKLNIAGLGAYAKGDKATVSINGAGSTITSGSNGSLATVDGGTINFGGGTLTHGVEGMTAFYADENSHINFTGGTTLNISAGVVFFGESSDYSATNTATHRYSGMGNVTVNLTDNGVNLGVFSGITTTWLSSSDFLNNATYGLKNIPKVAAINENSKWYKSSLENSTLTIGADVDRDSISMGATVGDAFNDIIIERSKVTLGTGKTVTSITSGNGLSLGSNASATAYTESGYTIDGTVDVSDNSGAKAPIALYTNFGYITINGTGIVTTSTATGSSGGIGSLGVNGSVLTNNGSITISNSNSTNRGIGMAVLATDITKVDSYGKDNNVTGTWGQISNVASITVTGDNGIGIYMENNVDGLSLTDMTVNNTGTITVTGDNAVGIVVKNSNTDNIGATLTLTETAANAKDIKVGNSGIGIYAKNSDINLNGSYGIEIGIGGVGIQLENDTNINQIGASGEFKVEYTGNSVANNTDVAMGMSFSGVSGNSYSNALDIRVLNTGGANGIGAKTVVGIYAVGEGTLTNSGNIISESTGSYGILTKGIDVVNTGTITVGASAITNSVTGIYTENAAVQTSGDKIVILGDGDSVNNENIIGIYAKSTAGTTGTKLIEITTGSAAMNIAGKSGVGIYVNDIDGDVFQLSNASDLNLSDSTAIAERRFGIFLSNAKNTSNKTTGKIVVGKNDIGIYLKDSILTNDGIIEVKNADTAVENIGIHNATENSDFKFINSGTIDINGVKNIGISATTFDSNDTQTNYLGNIELNDGVTGGTINIVATSLADGDIPLGIYAKGNNITISSNLVQSNMTISPNAVGIYMTGDNTSTTTGLMKMSLSSDTNGKIGIGSYYTGGAYADIGTITLTSTATATSAADSSELVRPIGLYYGTGSTQNGTDLIIDTGSQELIGMYYNAAIQTAFSNNGDITLNAKGVGAYLNNIDLTNTGDVIVNVGAASGYGLYIIGGTSTSTGHIQALDASSIGAILTGATFTNESSGNITSSGEASIGVYVENLSTFTNKGTINTTLAAVSPAEGSVGVFATNSTIVNEGAINSNYIGIYGKDESTIDYNLGTTTINGGIGIFVSGDISVPGAETTSTANFNDGDIVGAGTDAVAIFGTDNATVNFVGTDINLIGNNSAGVVVSEKSNLTLTGGNISVGVEGTGIFTENSNVNLSLYNGIVTMGNKGIALYSNDSTLSTGTLNVNYSGTDRGIGLYYDLTSGVVVNTVTVSQQLGSKNLVSLYANGIALTNNLDQTVLDGGIAIYGGEVTTPTTKYSTISNTGLITLTGENNIGIYLDGVGSTITSIGDIAGNALNNASASKIGVYVNSGDITGNTAYAFDIDGGIGIYLKSSVVSYTGTMELNGDSTTTNRTLGIYVGSEITTGTIATNINVNGGNAIGIYLAKDTAAGTASSLTYDGTLDMKSTNSTIDRGVGVLLEDGTTFTLGTSGVVKIDGANNIGFYAKAGSNLNITGGTVTNTPSGIFAYLEDATLNLSSANINYANVIVSGSLASVTNSTTVEVGISGLQGSNGATIINTTLGVINGLIDNAKALIGTDSGTTITNDGIINLAGKNSIGIYTVDSAYATSTGNVSVGDESVAYYAKNNGIIDVFGTTSIGKDSIYMYGDGGVLNYKRNDNIVMSNESIALALLNVSTVDFNNVEITTGNNSVGIYLSNLADVSGIVNLSKLNIKNDSIGIFIDNSLNNNINIDMDIIGSNGIGIFTEKNGSIVYSGNIASSLIEMKGIIKTGTGDVTNDGTIKLTGDSSVGIYSENGNIRNDINGNIEVGNGTILKSAVAMYGKNTNITNDGNLKLGSNAVGIYGDGVATITNNNTITGVGTVSTGIYSINSNVINNNVITLGNNSNGIFTKDGSVVNTGNITAGDNNSSGIYGSGTTTVNHNSGTITVGKESVGIATETGDIHVVAGTTINAGESSSYIYTASGTGVNDTNLNLSNYSIGMYTKAGNITNNANITVGGSHVAASGSPSKISVGMATESGVATNSASGKIFIPKDYGVGMVANNGGTAINRGEITVSGKFAYGIQATEYSYIENHGKIFVNGEGSRGIAATKYSEVTNYGDIFVNADNSEGIYVDGNATVDNKGTITINGAGRVGIFIGDNGNLVNKGSIVVTGGASASDAMVEGGGSLTNVGDITINGPSASIDGVTITNIGTITINGALDLGSVSLANSDGYVGTINAESFSDGEFIILPNVTQGSNKEMYVVQYLNGMTNIPNNGELSTISQSVSFLSTLQKDDSDPDLIRIVLIKIPYVKLLENTAAINLGAGLDELYANAVGSELEMFDAMDMISNDDELAATFDNEIRGNVYSNIQSRMLDISSEFESSFERLKRDEFNNITSLKFGVLSSGVERRAENPGVYDYDTITAGLMIAKNYYNNFYGFTTNWNLGMAHTDFEFVDFGSEEEVYSINGGVGLEKFIDTNKEFVYETRAELTLNTHDTTRELVLNSETFHNKGEYYSGVFEWRNKINYKLSNKFEQFASNLYGTMNLGYGTYSSFTEDGDGLELRGKSEEMYIARPGIGLDLSYTSYFENGKLALIGKMEAEYELGNVYNDANKFKIAGTDAGYYELEKPRKIEDIYSIEAEVIYSTYSGHSIGLTISAEAGSIKTTSYGLNGIYKF